MGANVSLKEAFSQQISFVNYAKKTNTFYTSWLPITNEKTGRTLTVIELEENTPGFCELEIRDGKFRFIRKM